MLCLQADNLVNKQMGQAIVCIDIPAVLDEGDEEKCIGLAYLITYCLVGLLGLRAIANMKTLLQPLQSGMLQIKHPNEAHWVMLPREKL